MVPPFLSQVHLLPRLPICVPQDQSFSVLSVTGGTTPVSYPCSSLLSIVSRSPQTCLRNGPCYLFTVTPGTKCRPVVLFVFRTCVKLFLYVNTFTIKGTMQQMK